MTGPVLTPLPAPPVLDAGGGVVLRPLGAPDAAGVREQYADAEAQRWTTLPEPYEPHHAEAFLARAAAQWDDGSVAALAVDLGGRFAGSVDLVLQEGSWAEVGFGLHPWARGRGAATTALSALLAWGFDALGLAGTTWRADVRNTASRRVAERCGFRVEGEVRGLLVHRGRRVDGWVGTLLAGDDRPVLVSR